MAAHVQPVHAQWLAWAAEAEAAIAAYAHRRPNWRGRRPPAWRYHVVRYRVVADTRRTRRGRRGVPRRLRHPPRRRAIALGARSRPRPILEQTMAEPCWPPQ